MLIYNLQYFAKDGPGGEKTEPATAKKLDNARKKGQVAKSKELGSAVTLLGVFVTLKLVLGMMGNKFLETFSMVYNKIPEYINANLSEISAVSFNKLISNILLQILMIAAPFFIVGVLIAILTDVLQVKWKVSTEPLKPKFNKLSPLSGFKRIFSSRSIFELVKSIAKVLIISYVAYDTLKDKAGVIRLFYEMPLNNALALIGDIVINLGYRISIFYLIVALLDFAYERYKFKQDMKMTKQEVKEEYKNSEGNPEIKGKIKQKMREVSQRRMMQALPEADVVITNPTHLAVAVKYDAESNPAPVVLAKGEDFLAQRIKEIANENAIEIVENKPLARMLYYNVDVNEEIPSELYQAVAEVLAFVYNMKKDKNP